MYVYVYTRVCVCLCFLNAHSPFIQMLSRVRLTPSFPKWSIEKMRTMQYVVQ